MSKENLAPDRQTRLGQLIDGEQTFTFTFDGTTYRAHPGDTIGSALAAAGVRFLSRSFKYHRPRGLMCVSGHCPNCLVQVGDEPNVRACRRQVKPGMEVRAQNAWPSLQRDLMSLTELGSRLLPVGFYYKTFMRPRALWPLYERVLRNAAGLGRVSTAPEPTTYDKEYLHADVTVVGAGPAGLSAAVAAVRHGARVLLFDENEQAGGHLRYSGDRSDGRSAATALHNLRDQLPDGTFYPSTTVLGYYEDNWLGAVSGNRLFKIRTGSLVVASGAYEQPLVFANNDLPGVMLGSGVQRLLHLYGVVPGREAVVVTANDEGWEVAANLQAAGVTVSAVVEQRRESDSPHVHTLVAAGVPLHWRSTILRAQGRSEVEAAVIVPVDQHRQPSTGACTTLPCDLLAVSVGWAPANELLYEAGGKIAYDQQWSEFLPQALPAGIYAAGRVTGPGSVARQLAEGRLAGRQAAAHALGSQAEPAAVDTAEEEELLTGPTTAVDRRTSDLVRVSGYGRSADGKRFVCFCEDVTDKEIDTAIAEGYDSIQLLKRYSTISMGPCQGKMCSANTIHLCARANDQPVSETGTTTARPPVTPIALGALAGQQMEPVKVSPAHAWHVAHGARMMVAGLWLRPEHYGDPVAEIRAVRERVGLIDVSTLGKLRLTGSGVPVLLDRLYVNSWQGLAPGRVRYGLMVNEEGIILDDGVTAALGEEEYYMTTTSSGATAVYEWIQWWLQSGWGEGVHVTPVTDLYAAFNLAGPRSRQVLASLADDDLGNEAFPYMHVRELAVAGIPCRLLRIGFTGELSYEIHCPAGHGHALWQALLEAGEAEGIRPFGLEAQRVLRLEKGHIIVGQDTDALSDPFAAGLAWAVKLEKGGFIGRRSLKRIGELEPAQRLSGFRMVTPDVVPAEGVQIVRQEEEALTIIGHVTSSRYSPTLHEAIGLCWLPATLAEQEGSRFTIRLDDGRLVEAQVHRGAFYDPQGKRLRI